MSLMRLLTAGKCLVGRNDPAVRYRLIEHKLLPKFGNAKKAFDGAPKVEASNSRPPLPTEGPSTIAPETRTKSQLNPSSGAADASSGQSPLPPLGGKVGIGAGNLPAPAPWTVRVKSKNNLPEGSVAARSTGSPPKVSSWLVKLWALLSGLFAQGRRQPVPAAVPQPAKLPVQGELSLDSVQVMRNDLSDTDLEIVPAKVQSLASGSSSKVPCLQESCMAKEEQGRSDLRVFARWRGAGKRGMAQSLMAPEAAEMRGAGKM
jgi:hypothetical protein